MNSSVRGLIDVDWADFDPWRIASVNHRLMEHPLMQPDQLVQLGTRLEAAGRVRTHSNDVEAGTSFNHAPQLHPNRKSAAETLAQIRDAKAWMSLLNVQTDATYRTLVDEVLGELKPGIDRVDPGMCYRGGWIFVTSPNTVTPFHFDKEHNFIMQVSGRKRLYVWDHRDIVAASEHARDRFHARHERDLLVWRDDLRERARVFHLEPGQGAYMPSTSPHMVENLDNPSITISFTYYTASTRRDSLLHRVHAQLRERGIDLPAVGTHRIVDTLLHAGCRAASAVKRQVRRSLGHAIQTDGAPYALSNG